MMRLEPVDLPMYVHFHLSFLKLWSYVVLRLVFGNILLFLS